jgi:hypothetical protein
VEVGLEGDWDEGEGEVFLLDGDLLLIKTLGEGFLKLLVLFLF